MAPDERHYENVIRYLADQGTVVPLLGSRVTGMLPDAEEIAAGLARRFGLDAEDLDLARVAQHVLVSSGRPDLVRTLRQLLAKEPEPSAVHRFLARLPGEFERLGVSPQYQMIVSTNYDATLERAFDEANEPYDLALYLAAGEDAGRFLHVPFDRDPELITVPNRYGGFPIDEFGELERTVIVKIHGGIEPKAVGYGGKDNFVITEDHYIEYLSAGPVESLIPVQILGKLTESHCLFLGYAMRDWYLRVFLNRIWHGRPLSCKSWAIARQPSALEKDFWSQFGVEFFAVGLDEYAAGLQHQLLSRGVVT
jgi:SIR2-like domain